MEDLWALAEVKEEDEIDSLLDPDSEGLPVLWW